MKKAVILYIAVLSLFLCVTGYIFLQRADTSHYLLADYTQPSQIQKININTATPEQLQIIPGIGPAISERIIAYRNENGPYSSIEDVMDVKGIGEQLFSRLEIYTTVGD